MVNEAGRVALGHAGWQIKKQNAKPTRDAKEAPIADHHTHFASATLSVSVLFRADRLYR